MNLVRCALPAIAAALLIQTAFALDVDFLDYFAIGSNTSFWDDRTPESEDQFWAARERLWLQAQRNAVSAFVRYDVESARYYEGDYDLQARSFLGQALLKYSSKTLEAHIGDEQVSVGRGLDLSVVEREEFREELTLQGIGAMARTDYLRIEAQGGYINMIEGPPILPERAGEPYPSFEQRDVLWFVCGGPTPRGASVELVYAGGEIKPEEGNKSDLPDPFRLYGVNAELFGELGELFIGYASYTRENRFKDASEETEGRALYFSGTATAGSVTIVVEGKDYYNFLFEYADPPTLDHPKLAFGEATYDDVSGVRTEVRWSVLSPLTLRLDGYYQDRRIAGFATEITRHIYGGFDYFSPRLNASVDGGYRHEEYGYYHHGYISIEARPISWLSVDAYYHFKDFYSFNPALKSDYTDDLYRFGLSYRGIANLYVQYERSDEPTSAAAIPYASLSLEGPDYWGGGAILQPADWLKAEVFYGQERGGLSCAGGLCRALPPFQGLRAELELVF